MEEKRILSSKKTKENKPTESGDTKSNLPAKRTEHCVYNHCDNTGRCIANCWYNQKSHFEEDCIGNKRKPVDPPKPPTRLGW